MFLTHERPRTGRQRQPPLEQAIGNLEATDLRAALALQQPALRAQHELARRRIRAARHRRPHRAARSRSADHRCARRCRRAVPTAADPCVPDVWKNCRCRRSACSSSCIASAHIHGPMYRRDIRVASWEVAGSSRSWGRRNESQCLWRSGARIQQNQRPGFMESTDMLRRDPPRPADERFGAAFYQRYYRHAGTQVVVAGRHAPPCRVHCCLRAARRAARCARFSTSAAASG